jgi:hypothetical protein
MKARRSWPGFSENSVCALNVRIPPQFFSVGQCNSISGRTNVEVVNRVHRRWSGRPASREPLHGDAYAGWYFFEKFSNMDWFIFFLLTARAFISFRLFAHLPCPPACQMFSSIGFGGRRQLIGRSERSLILQARFNASRLTLACAERVYLRSFGKVCRNCIAHRCALCRRDFTARFGSSGLTGRSEAGQGQSYPF